MKGFKDKMGFEMGLKDGCQAGLWRVEGREGLLQAQFKGSVEEQITGDRKA